jgi:hypothetical protein
MGDILRSCERATQVARFNRLRRCSFVTSRLEEVVEDTLCGIVGLLLGTSRAGWGGGQIRDPTHGLC